MQTHIYIPLLVFLLGFGFNGFSQNFINPEEERSINEKREFGNFVDLQSPSLNFQKKKALPVSNQIFIEQIGAGNNINANTSSENSDLKLFQYGDENHISFIVDAKNLEGTIIQDGNNNNAFDFTVNSDQDVSANLLQQGNNLHFERYGANSISNNLKFIQTGDTKAIIVRNFQ